jgi:uncharacterized protein
LNPVGAALLLIFACVQFIVTRLLLGWARRRLKGPALRLAQAAAVLFGILALLGYACSMSDLVSRVGVPGSVALVVGAAAFAYFIAVTALLAIRAFLRLVRRHLDADVNPGRRRVLNAAGNVAMAAPFVVMGYGSLIQRTDFRVREIDVALPGLPRDLDGLRLLQLSDIHLSAFLSERELARVVDAALETRPHVAVVTGDLISFEGDPLDACIRQLARVKADAGVFGCMGNHERYAKVEDFAAEIAAKAGIRFLRHQSHALRFGDAVLNLAGVDYQSMAGRKQYLHRAERLLAPGACNVLLSHNPDVFPVAARQGYNLLLAGHTHGGQVRVEILDQSLNPARFFTPYVYGLYRLGASAAYVTRGIGTIGIPARIGAPPEISLLRLRKA